MPLRPSSRHSHGSTHQGALADSDANLQDSIEEYTGRENVQWPTWVESVRSLLARLTA